VVESLLHTTQGLDDNLQLLSDEGIVAFVGCFEPLPSVEPSLTVTWNLVSDMVARTTGQHEVLERP
jgi:hypothetical protein